MPPSSPLSTAQTSPRLPNLRLWTGPFGANRETRTYSTIKEIGSGGEAVVYLVKNIKLNDYFVRKEGRKRRSAWNEVKILAALRPCLNIVRVLEAYDTSPILKTYMEWCDLGDLGDFIVYYFDAAKRVPESFQWHVLLGLARALRYCHHGILATGGEATTGWVPVVHRDVKTHNVLLSSSSPTEGYGYPAIKLADFGLAVKTATPEEYSKDGHFAGTIEFLPPEMPVQTAKGDIWALGAILHTMVWGRLPISEPPEGVEFEAWVRKPKARCPRKAPYGYSEAYRKAMAKCLELDMHARWTAKEMLERMEKMAGLMSRTTAEGWVALEGKYGGTRNDILDGIMASLTEGQTGS